MFCCTAWDGSFDISGLPTKKWQPQSSMNIHLGAELL